MTELIDEILGHLADLPLLTETDDTVLKIKVRYYGKAAEMVGGGLRAYANIDADWLKDAIKWAHLIKTKDGALSYSQFTDNPDFQSAVKNMLDVLVTLPIQPGDEESDVFIEIHYFGHLEGVGRSCLSVHEAKATWLRPIVQSLKRQS